MNDDAIIAHTIFFVRPLFPLVVGSRTAFGRFYALNALITLALAIITIMCNHALSCDVAIANTLVLEVTTNTYFFSFHRLNTH